MNYVNLDKLTELLKQIRVLGEMYQNDAASSAMQAVRGGNAKDMVDAKIAVARYEHGQYLAEQMNNLVRKYWPVEAEKK